MADSQTDLDARDGERTITSSITLTSTDSDREAALRERRTHTGEWSKQLRSRRSTTSRPCPRCAKTVR